MAAGTRRPLKRWLVLGAGGAGKSTLAREMAEILDLPVIHLDRHFWSPRWVEPDKEEWARQVVELSAQDEWIMDGNYGGTLSSRLGRAEAAVLLDLPVWRCIWGIYHRSRLHRGSVRPDMAEGCPEQLPDWEFVRYVSSYKWRSRPKVLRKIAGEPLVKLYHLKSRQDGLRFLGELRTAS